MAQNNQLVDLSAARTFVEANWPNDPLLLHIALNLLEKLPRVDNKEVVYCKECLFWEEYTSSLVGKVMCCTGQGCMRIHKTENDYCSVGERKNYANEKTAD